MLERLSLRTRLVLGVIALALVVFAAADAATYSSLRAYLVRQVDTSLDDAHHAVDSAAGDLGRGQVGPGDVLTGAVRGYYVEVRRRDGSIVTAGAASRFGGDHAPSPPELPPRLSLHSSGGPDGERVSYFTVGTRSEDDRYRVRAWTSAASPYTFLLAAPLETADQTLHHLLAIELLVTGLALAALAVLALWVVRVGLHPLAAIGRTAAAIAAGDLGRRVERAEDRTEVGRLGLALNGMLEQIEAGYRAKTESERKLRRFVADASHELRTPLAAVRAYAELFPRGSATRPDDLERSLHGIARESERMSRLVDSLLLLARLDEGRPLERKPVRLDEIAREAVETARAVAPEREVELTVEGVTVLGDRDRLRQIVDNLLANARAYTPAGTRVRVSVGHAAGLAFLRVADQGPGLTAEQAEHVFERFYRADASRARSHGGAGLGLAIVAAIAAAHDGSVRVDSEPGRGATFTVALPSVT